MELTIFRNDLFFDDVGSHSLNIELDDGHGAPQRYPLVIDVRVSEKYLQRGLAKDKDAHRERTEEQIYLRQLHLS